MGIGLTITYSTVQAKMPVVILSLRGSLDAYSEHQLLDAAQKAFDEGTRFILLDLSDVETLASAGIRAIHRVFLLFKPQDELLDVVHVKLAGAPPPIYQVLSITGILYSNPMYDSVAAALEGWKN